MNLQDATINALMGINEAKGSNKTYTCIEDRQHGDFCVGETMTAEEWGKTAMGWADSDGWTNPDEPLLQNFKTEQDCINFIDDMWEITLVPSDSPEAKEFLDEARSHKECDNKTHQICRGIKNKQNKQNKKVTETIDVKAYTVTVSDGENQHSFQYYAEKEKTLDDVFNEIYDYVIF